MGQQQLLLVILVTIIVGIATVVAINVFGSAANNANVSAVEQDLLSMAAAAQGYYMEPEMMGGGGGNFTGLTFRDLGGVACDAISDDGLKCQNANGVYEITSSTDTDVTIEATPLQAGGLASIKISEDDAQIQAYDPTGTGPTAISGG